MPAISDPVAITLKDVAMIFPSGTQALSPITLNIPRGEFVCLLGPSGCGKSTLLRIIAGLQPPSSGTVSIENATRSFAFVFQDAHLLPWRNALRNVALPLELRGIGTGERLSAATDMLEQVGLGEFAQHHPAQLSGGMRMRVSLARALISNPSLLLLDEPFGAVDEMTRQKLDEQLLALWRERGMTVVFVTHSVVEAAFLAQRAIVLTPRPGRIALDHRMNLPAERDLALRASPAFAAECGVLYRSLEKGGQRE